MLKRGETDIAYAIRGALARAPAYAGADAQGDWRCVHAGIIFLINGIPSRRGGSARPAANMHRRRSLTMLNTGPAKITASSIPSGCEFAGLRPYSYDPEGQTASNEAGTRAGSTRVRSTRHRVHFDREAVANYLQAIGSTSP